jgi:small subunit ribosomal protein S14
VAKKSMLAKNEQRKQTVQKFKARRDELIKIIKDPAASVDQKLEAYAKLSKMPRDACPVRVRNRCEVTGRPRGYLSKFKMSRVSFRELSLQGKIPGVTKSSW